MQPDAPFRGPRASLLERRAALAGSLDARADASRAVPELKRRLQVIDAALAGDRARLLGSLDVATPCDAKWQRMRGTKSERFCGDCRRSVYDLEHMTEAEIQRLFVEPTADGEPPCIRMRRRADGRLVTADCPATPFRMRARKRVGPYVVVALVLAAVGALVWRSLGEEVRTMGVAASSTEVEGLRGMSDF